MRRVAILVAMFAAAGGCKKQFAWSETRATTVTAGPYTITIPPGWRDVAELQDDSMKIKLPAGSVGMMAEKLGDQGFQSNIVVTWAPFPTNVPKPSCEQFAAAAVQQFGTQPRDVKTIAVDGDPGCTYAMTAHAAAGTQAIRIQGNHVLVVNCLRTLAGDASADAACATIRESLHFPTS